MKRPLPGTSVTKPPCLFFVLEKLVKRRLAFRVALVHPSVCLTMMEKIGHLCYMDTFVVLFMVSSKGMYNVRFYYMGNSHLLNITEIQTVTPVHHNHTVKVTRLCHLSCLTDHHKKLDVITHANFIQTVLKSLIVYTTSIKYSSLVFMLTTLKCAHVRLYEHFVTKVEKWGHISSF